ncbi:hypothetical protein SK854_35025 [Lentzea sp. BCCO 10_0061]|uniref:DUF2613 family protein n=1 Tax=Lentzea sokolovensis TaxID=3095429 RepID=A0ABU4V6E5_9PSEU|nr:hypothetical protein [Lentzea sp. BCCO 10_0061]MDX8147368.1 hypothetical protein [Lentzea sp. BCCO 10_0061]
MELVSVLVAIVAGAALAGGVGVIVVEQNSPDKVVEQRIEQGQKAEEPVVLDYGSR